MTPQVPLLMAAALMLSGCATLSLSQPELPTVPAWSASQMASPSPVAMDWWKTFDDPTLNALVARALVRNADIRAASANLQAASALAGEARAGFLPSGDVNASVVRGRVAGLAQPPIPGTPDRLPSQTLASAGASLGWELDLFGRIRANLDGARANAAEALWLQRQTQAAVAAAVVRAYADHGAARRAADLTTRRAQALAAVLAHRQRAQALGAIAASDVEGDRIAHAQAVAEVAPWRALEANAARRLTTLTGDTPRPTVAGARELTSPMILSAGDPTAMLRRRPDVSAAEQRWAAAAAAAKVAVADLYPRLTLGGQIGLAAKPDRLSDAGALNFGLGPSLSWGVFDMPRLRARVAAADADADAALARWEGVVLAALEETDSALETWGQTRLAADRVKEAADASRRAFAAAESRHAAGAASDAALEIARVNHLNAELAANDATARANHAWIAAQLALGAGWRTSETAPTQTGAR